jgi:DNA-binding NtrC family response regulator
MKTYKQALLEWQKEFITAAIIASEGSMIKAAQSVGVNRSHFYKLCDRVGIRRDDQRLRPPRKANKGNEAWQKLGQQEHAS